jgi:hypothetical protein
MELRFDPCRLVRQVKQFPAPGEEVTVPRRAGTGQKEARRAAGGRFVSLGAIRFNRGGDEMCCPNCRCGNGLGAFVSATPGTPVSIRLRLCAPRRSLGFCKAHSSAHSRRRIFTTPVDTPCDDDRGGPPRHCQVGSPAGPTKSNPGNAVNGYYCHSPTATEADRMQKPASGAVPAQTCHGETHKIDARRCQDRASYPRTGTPRDPATAGLSTTGPPVGQVAGGLSELAAHEFPHAGGFAVRVPRRSGCFLANADRKNVCKPGRRGVPCGA